MGSRIRGAGYVPLTLYFAKVGLSRNACGEEVRAATIADMPAIVASSAVHRRILFDLNPFWHPHPEADARSGGWMTCSLTLADRNMAVSDPHQQDGRLRHLPTRDRAAFSALTRHQNHRRIDDFNHTVSGHPEVLGQTA